MDKIQFNKITKKCFLEYGFSKIKNKYILALDDVTIVVGFYSWRGVKSFDFYFFINCLYDASVKFNEKYDCMTTIKMEHSPSLPGYHKHEILFETYTEEEYTEMLTNMLHKYFDPYKENAFEFIRNNTHTMCLRKQAEAFLGLM